MNNLRLLSIFIILVIVCMPLPAHAQEPAFDIAVYANPMHLPTGATTVALHADTRRWYGVDLLMAHSYLAGRQFHDLRTGDTVTLRYGETTIQLTVTGRRLYRDANMYEYGEYVDMQTGQHMTPDAIISEHIVSAGARAALWTCAQMNGHTRGGRLLVLLR